MIIHRFAPKAGLAVVVPESLDDLWCLRRVIDQGDFVASSTTRVSKQQREYARPDGGERVRVRMCLETQRISFDRTLGRLRVSGRIVEVSEEMLSKGSSHSLTISYGKPLSIRKRRWNERQISLLRETQEGEDPTIILALDHREAGIGLLLGTSLHTYPPIHSDQEGKIYARDRTSSGRYFHEIEEALARTGRPSARLYILGPGPAKFSLANYLGGEGERWKIEVLDGFDVEGTDGVYLALHSDRLKEAIEGSKIGKVALILEEVSRRIGVNDPRVSLSFKEGSKAASLGAVGELLISDRVFEEGVDDEVVIGLIDTVERYRGRAYLLDDTTEVGKRLSGLGGVVALLRFPIS